jgi:carboxylesterase
VRLKKLAIGGLVVPSLPFFGVMLNNQPFFLQGTLNNNHACLLLHGLGGGTYEVQLLGQYLHRYGWTVQAINYPGHDQPTSIMPTSTWHQWYDCVRDTYQKLNENYSSVSVVGFSMGSILGLHLAANSLIEKLVLLSPYISIKYQFYYLLPPEVYLLSIGRLINNVPRFRKPVREEYMKKEAKQAAFFRTFNLFAVRSAIELIELVKTELPDICVPTLLIQSTQDSLVDPSGAVFIHEHLGSSVKKLHWLQKSDHLITLDLEREEVFSLVRVFLSS